ncbi:MAG: PstS family phosphate ABC transporter substrate-binding protein [Bacillota bacterium]
MNNKRKLILVGLLAFVLLLVVACEPQQGEPDRIGSWGQINQVVARGEDWQQIVQNSPFQLGERSVRGSWNVSEGQEDYYEIKFGTYPSLDGSTVAVPMAVEFARQHLGFSDQDANDFSVFSTTHYAYENLIYAKPNSAGMIRSTTTFLEENHAVDLIIATEPSDEELALAKQNNVQLVKKPVCYDAFVFITHKDNPVNSLTVEQIRDIYTGKITNWKEVGGEDREIAAYQREENSGSQTAMEKLVMKGQAMLPPPKVEVVAGMGELIEVVGEYQNDKSSIGYTYQYYIDTLYKNDNIKVLQVEGISSAPQNLRNNTYPFTTCYYGVIRGGEEEATGGKFLDWMISDEGQRCIEQAGYIPLR